MKTIYTIGEIAKLLGVSSEQIRKYEKEGLLSIYRDENNYRYYESPDLTLLMLIRKYRNLDFSIKEIKTLLNGNLDECLNLYTDCASRIDEKIQRLNDMKNHVLDNHVKLMQLKKYDSEIMLEQMPTLKGFIYRNNRTIMTDFLNNEQLGQIMKSVPPLTYIINYDNSILKNRDGDAFYSVGYACDTSYDVCLPKGSSYFETKPKLCVTIVIKHTVNIIEEKWENSNVYNDFLRSGVLDYIEANKYSVCGDILGIKLFDYYNSESFVHYIKYWIPVLTLNPV